MAGTCKGLAAARHVVPDDTCAPGQLHDLLSRCQGGPPVNDQLRLPRSAPLRLLVAHAATLGQLAALTSCFAAVAALVKGQFVVTARRVECWTALSMQCNATTHNHLLSYCQAGLLAHCQL